MFLLRCLASHRACLGAVVRDDLGTKGLLFSLCCLQLMMCRNATRCREHENVLVGRPTTSQTFTLDHFRTLLSLTTH